MALTAEQEVMIAQVMRAPLSVVQGKTLIAAEEELVIDDADLWHAKKNKIAVELDGEVIYKIRTLLNEIRDRVRGVYGLPPYEEELAGSSTGSFAIPNVPVF